MPAQISLSDVFSALYMFYPEAPAEAVEGFAKTAQDCLENVPQGHQTIRLTNLAHQHFGDLEKAVDFGLELDTRFPELWSGTQQLA
jgi:hypothetical protein